MFLGDSLTYGGEWVELLQNKNIVNRGITGDKTYGVLNRINQIIEMHPKKIFLMVGINDLNEGRDIDNIINDYDKILATLKNELPTTKIYVQSVLPNSVLSNSNQKITTLNSRVEQIAEKYNLVYIDLYPSMLFNEKLNNELTNDGTHLNGKGYAIWRDRIVNFVN